MTLLIKPSRPPELSTPSIAECDKKNASKKAKSLRNLIKEWTTLLKEANVPHEFISRLTRQIEIDAEALEKKPTLYVAYATSSKYKILDRIQPQLVLLVRHMLVKKLREKEIYSIYDKENKDTIEAIKSYLKEIFDKLEEAYAKYLDNDYPHFETLFITACENQLYSFDSEFFIKGQNGEPRKVLYPSPFCSF